MSNVKNYAEQGGEQWVIEGTLTISDGGKLVLGDVPLTRTGNQADSTASTVAELTTDLNALLAKLKTAGLMDADNG
jgi:hypothetical protein